MRKLILILACIAIAPIGFLSVLIAILVIYHHNYSEINNKLDPNKRVAYAALPTAQNIFSANIGEDDGRVEKIRQFLARFHSPLEPYAQEIIDAADMYEIDYRLIPAIAMQESNLCKVIPANSYNCWGFGIYAGKVTRFKDYKEAIDTVTRTLAIRYKNKGLVTPDQIMTMWTPSSNGSWAFSVNHFMNILE